MRDDSEGEFAEAHGNGEPNAEELERRAARRRCGWVPSNSNGTEVKCGLATFTFGRCKGLLLVGMIQHCNCASVLDIEQECHLDLSAQCIACVLSANSADRQMFEGSRPIYRGGINTWLGRVYTHGSVSLLANRPSRAREMCKRSRSLPQRERQSIEAHPLLRFNRRWRHAGGSDGDNGAVD